MWWTTDGIGYSMCRSLLYGRMDWTVDGHGLGPSIELDRFDHRSSITWAVDTLILINPQYP